MFIASFAAASVLPAFFPPLPIPSSPQSWQGTVRRVLIHHEHLLHVSKSQGSHQVSLNQWAYTQLIPRALKVLTYGHERHYFVFISFMPINFHEPNTFTFLTLYQNVMSNWKNPSRKVTWAKIMLLFYLRNFLKAVFSHKNPETSITKKPRTNKQTNITQQNKTKGEKKGKLWCLLNSSLTALFCF